jgi:CheY-like chemotaxis protein
MAVVLTRLERSPLASARTVGGPQPLSGGVAKGGSAPHGVSQSGSSDGGSAQAGLRRSSEESAGGMPHILVVDDEEDLQELLQYNLSKDGYRVSCVGTGEEALKFERRQPPDLVVLDLMLPAVDGLEVCRRLKGDPKTRDVPIIMLTAKSEEGDVVAGL